MDKHQADPVLLNRILSADGDEAVGTWDGKSVDDLVQELDRIEEFADANYSGLPHQDNIPEDLRNPIALDFPIWTCDSSGRCLVGDNATEIRTADQIRSHYQQKYGGVEQFKNKLHQEIQERNKKLQR